MTCSPKKFGQLYNEFMQHEEALLSWKAGEYSTDEDRLQNFREIAAFIGDKPVCITPSFVALLYLLKHVQSIKNAVISGNVKWAWEAKGGEGTKQRIADARNYLLLLAACLDEESEAKDETMPDVCACGKCKENAVGRDSKV